MADAPSHSAPGNTNAHEKTDANSGNLYKVAGSIIGLILASFVAMYFLWKAFEKNPPEVTSQASEVAQKTLLPPAPRLQAQPALELEQFQAMEDSILTTYGWVDKGSGLVRVPIESAIVRVANEGLPYDTSLAGKQ